MIKSVATVGFVMSHACPLKCDFCCHDRETIGTGRIARQMVVDAMTAFASEPCVTDFAFTGGDPFLYYGDIVSALREARANGVRQPFYMVTSAYWAEPGKTRPVLDELKALDMRKIVLSYDHEHTKWVTPEQIMDVCRHAAEIDLPVEVWGSFWNKGETVQDLLPDIDKWAIVSNFSVARAGRAGRADRPMTRKLAIKEIYGCGQANHYLMAIYPDGEVFPCCAGDFNRSAKLSCGNIRRNTPAEILDQAFGNIHVRTAKELGWDLLYAVVDAHFPELTPELPRFEDVDSTCQICRTLNVTLKDRLAPAYAMIETEYAASRAELEWDRQPGVEGGRRRLDGQYLTREDLRARFEADPALRRRYLTDRAVIELS